MMWILRLQWTLAVQLLTQRDPTVVLVSTLPWVRSARGNTILTDHAVAESLVLVAGSGGLRLRSSAAH